MLADPLKLDGVPDETLNAINRIFDVIDSGVDAAHQVLHRGAQTEAKLQSKRRAEIIDAEHVERPKTKAKEGARPVAVAKRPHYYIVEAVSPSGHTIFVVTDGGNARTECPTREFANQILRALDKASGQGSAP